MEKPEPIYFEGRNAEGGQLVYWRADQETQKLAELLPPHSRVLDLGSGSGHNSLWLAEQGHNVVALEYNPDFVKDGVFFAKHLGKAALAHNFVVGDIGELPIKGEFDTVMCNKVLQFVTKGEAQAVLEAMTKLTKPGGFNLLRVYVGTESDQDKVPHRNLFAPKAVEKFYKDSGWNVTPVGGSRRNMQYVGGRWSYSSHDSLIAQKPLTAIRPGPPKTYLGMPLSYWRRADPEIADLIESGVLSE